MRPVASAISALLLASACSAWPSGWEALEMVKREVAPLVRRATTTSYNLSYTASTEGNTATTVTTDATSASGTVSTTQTTTGSDASETSSASTTEKTTGTGTITSGATSASTDSSSSNTTSVETFSADLPAGGISMITPNPTTTTYYKIDNYVTFAWNYTSVSVLPTAVDILAAGSSASVTYTIALNQSVTASTQAFTWNTSEWQTEAAVSLLTDKYTLIVYDAAKAVTASASPGYLDTADTFTFGMYLAESYSPTAQWLCATCNGAVTQAERQTVIAICAMAGITVLSFGWFTGVAGLW